jgi:cysteine-rich repeat protein
MTCGDGNVQLQCNEECDDGNTTSGDGCSSTCQSQPGLGCPFTPLPGCRLPFVPAKASIDILDQERIGGLKFKWRWRRGAATDAAEFGDPLATTSYQLCVYDQDMLLTGATAPAGGTCGVTNPKPCWRRRGGKGFRYRDIPQSILPGGINRVSLKAGRDGKAEVQVHATGGIFEFPSNGGLGLADLAAIQQPFRVQVQNSDGLCFEAAFSAPPDRQDPNRFEDLGD